MLWGRRAGALASLHSCPYSLPPNSHEYFQGFWLPMDLSLQW